MAATITSVISGRSERVAGCNEYEILESRWVKGILVASRIVAQAKKDIEIYKRAGIIDISCK